MKTILAATDFTVAAHNACVYAASLAREFNARLILFSAYEPMPLSTEVPLNYSQDELRARAEYHLVKAVEALQISHSNIRVETMCREGIIVGAMISAAQQENADIIVTGMKNSGKGIRKLFGSTVTALVRKSDRPVIVVPEAAVFAKLDTMALANDHDMDTDTDPQRFNVLRELGERFKSKLYVVRIAKNQYEESYEVYNRPLRLMKMVRSLEPVYECFEDSNQERGLNEFVKRYDVNMLALLPHHHSVADRLFAKSTTRTMVFDTEVPLLIIPGFN